MVILISGSINAGKTTTRKALAKKLGIHHSFDIDEICAPNVEGEQKYAEKIALAIEKINALTAQGESVIASYVIRQEDYEQIMMGLNDKRAFFVTLAPPLKNALSVYGGRELSEWELQRIKHLYDTGIATPAFGEIINNGGMPVDEVVATIEKLLEKAFVSANKIHA